MTNYKNIMDQIKSAVTLDQKEEAIVAGMRALPTLNLVELLSNELIRPYAFSELEVRQPENLDAWCDACYEQKIEVDPLSFFAV